MSTDGPPRTPVVEEQVGDVSVVRMCDPARSNALTPGMVGSLARAVSAAAGTALVLCADGRNFCSGGDHTAFVELPLEGRRAYLADIKALLAAVRGTAMPTVACVQGAAIGGGVELALHCDLVVAADDARFQLPHVATGARMGRSGYAALRERTGTGVARRMVLLGDVLPAESALAAGLVDHVSRRADVFSAAMSVAAQLAAQPQDTMEHARRALAGTAPPSP